MKQRVQCGLTAGLAIVGASVIAITPIAPSTTASPRAVEASTTLTANFTGLNQAELAGLSALRLVEQFQQAPFVPLVALMAIAGGDEEQLYTVIRNIIDAPLYVADPLFEAVAITLPAALGGGSDHITNTTAGDGGFMQLRNELVVLRDALHQPFADALGVSAGTDRNDAFELSRAFLASLERVVTGAISAPLGLIPIAQAFLENDNEGLYMAIRQYTDAPLWAVDPAIEGLAQALPDSLGGGSDGDFHTDAPEDGALMQFRNRQLWGATRDTRVAIANALGVDVNSNGDVVDNDTLNRSGQLSLLKAEGDDADNESLKSSEAPASQLNSKTKQTADKPEADGNKVVSNFKAAVKKLTTKPAEKASADTE